MSSTTDNTAVVDRFYAALQSGDLDTARACFTPTAHIWHSFDGIAHDLDSAAKGWVDYVAAFPERIPNDIRRHAIEGGLVQQYLATVRTPDGKRKGWPVCVVFRIVDGLIDRLDEYIDPKSSFVLGDGEARAPGL